MTVEELINELKTIEDQKRKVVITAYDSEYGVVTVRGVDFITRYDGYYELSGEIVKFIHDNNDMNTAEYIDKYGNITYY